MDSLTSKEVSRLFRVSLTTVGRWVREGRLTAHRTPGGKFRISRAEVEALMQQSAADKVDESAAVA